MPTTFNGIVQVIGCTNSAERVNFSEVDQSDQQLSINLTIVELESFQDVELVDFVYDTFSNIS